jgi:hypothetical protein
MRGWHGVSRGAWLRLLFDAAPPRLDAAAYLVAALGALLRHPVAQADIDILTESDSNGSKITLQIPKE